MRIGYLCKYAPIELLESMGAEVVRIMPQAADFNQADMLMHANMCSFIKGVLEEVSLSQRAAGETDAERRPFDGILLTNCCDSTRRLYDVLKKEYPEKFIYMIDVPRTTGRGAEAFFADSMKAMIKAYESHSGVSFSIPEFSRAISYSENGGASGTAGNETQVFGMTTHAASENGGAPGAAGQQVKDEFGKNSSEICIGLMGARCSRGVLDMIHNYNIEVLFDMTCTGVNREFQIPKELLSEHEASNASRSMEEKAKEKEKAEEDRTGVDGAADTGGKGRKTEGSVDGDNMEGKQPDGDLLLEAYAGHLLLQTPCMRMHDIQPRQKILEDVQDRLDGIIYHTVKFCDNYSYEYADLHTKIGVPIQKFETDATSQCEGQIRTRVEAFLESIAQAKGLQASEIMKAKGEKRKAMNGRLHVLGIDSGSTSTNAVILNQDGEIEAYAVVRTGAKSGESAEAVLAEVLKKAALSRDDIDRIVSTGYGRVSIPFADRNVTEISCHGKGAHYFYPEVRTVLDIGGQDSKAIRLNEKGDVIDFVMNDKCAAGTGRFLEMMARTLQIDLEQLGEESLHWKQDLDISSMCSVFAESEVISLIADNRETCDIAHGIHKAVANKSISLLKRVGLEPGYMMTGGVAKNPGAVREIEEKLGEKLFICEEPEIVGATGAALFGLEECMSESEH